MDTHEVCQSLLVEERHDKIEMIIKMVYKYKRRYTSVLVQLLLIGSSIQVLLTVFAVIKTDSLYCWIIGVKEVFTW